jgi:hypothetical protein
VRSGPSAPQRRIVHDVVLEQGEGVQEFEPGCGAQGGGVFIRPAQPAQVHERRPQALAAVDEPHQHIGGDVDAGALQLRQAVGVDEVGDMRQDPAPHPVAPDLEFRPRRREHQAGGAVPAAARRGVDRTQWSLLVPGFPCPCL